MTRKPDIQIPEGEKKFLRMGPLIPPRCSWTLPTENFYLKTNNKIACSFLCTFLCFLLGSCADFVESLQLLVNDVWYEKKNSCPFHAPRECWQLSASSSLLFVYIKFEPTKLLNLKMIVIHMISSIASPKETRFRRAFTPSSPLSPPQGFKDFVLKGQFLTFGGGNWQRPGCGSLWHR